MCVIATGSPPRGRGKEVGPLPLLGGTRITLAWAGKRLPLPDIAAQTQDHPRVGGEKSGSVFALGRSSGSPPRGRGKGLGLAVNVLGDGIIPAWAGKSYCPATRSFGSWDHPRADGEKGHPVRLIDLAVGSPPRRRGKVRHSRTLMCAPGITPAWAGKSCGWASCGGLSWDHPRMGGEKMTRRYSSVPVPGSPPRGRGKGAGEPLRLLDGGITPAWAGKSCQPDCRTSRTWDHPRMGGEKPLRAYAPPGR